MKILKVKLIYVIALAIAISLAFTLVNTVNTWAIDQTGVTVVRIGEFPNEKVMMFGVDEEGNLAVIGDDARGTIKPAEFILRVKDNGGWKNYDIKSVSKGAIIETEKASPGCKWVFDGNRWYRICD